jgi:DNA-binding PadR family transcriptional regulator
MPADDQLPLTEVTYFVLLSLALVPKHGYAIIKEVESLSEGRVVLATGTLYSALHRMLEDGWIERVADPARAESGRERKLYRLTDIGEKVLNREVARLRKLVQLGSLFEGGT